MEYKTICLATREELNIYMSPVRQELLRTLRLGDGPMTPKALADKLHISPSSVQHHLKKLLSLGVVEVDHQALINGITATYYREVAATVQVGLGQTDDLREEREAVVSGMVSRVLQGFFTRTRVMAPAEVDRCGLLANGVLCLSPEEREGLMGLVNQYLLDHEVPTPEKRERWEYVVLAYRPEVEP